MNASALTLDTFFQFSDLHQPGGGKLKKLESARPMKRAQRQLRKTAGRHTAPLTANDLITPMSELLDVSLMDIIVRAWNSNNLFEKYLDPEKYDPSKPVLISLKKHSITSTHAPRIDINMNGSRLGQIDFEIDLTLTLEGVILELRGGELREIRTGQLVGSGTLKCEKLVLLKRSTGAIDVPGKITFPGKLN